MSLIALVLGNLWAKKSRSIGIAFAIGIAVMTVVTLTVVSSGLESSAAEVLAVGKSDFTVAQNGVSDILFSSLDNGQVQEVRSTRGVSSAVGVLLETERINAANPLFIEIGIAPADLRPFGVTVVAGRPYGATASHQVMLGWRAAQNLGLHVGDRFEGNGTWNTVVGIYSTGISYGDLGAMFPLPALQAYNRVPGSVTLAFVKMVPDPRFRGGAHDDVGPSRADHHSNGNAVRSGRPQPRVPEGGRHGQHRPCHSDRRSHRGQYHAALALRANPGVRLAPCRRLGPDPSGLPRCRRRDRPGGGWFGPGGRAFLCRHRRSRSTCLSSPESSMPITRRVHSGGGSSPASAWPCSAPCIPALRAANLIPLKALSHE